MALLYLQTILRADHQAPIFEQTMANYRHIKPWMKLAEVETLLGPVSECEREPWMVKVEQMHQDEYFGVELAHRWTQWRKWQDPKNKDRWIVVYFYEDRVYQTFDRGI